MSSELYITEGPVLKPRSHTHEVCQDSRSFKLKEGLVSTVQTLNTIVVVGNPCLALLTQVRKDTDMDVGTVIDRWIYTHKDR